MNAFRENLKTYLEIEKILNEFFNAFHYCIINCVQKEPETALRSARRGCCNDKYYKIHDLKHPAFELLRQEREKIYGKPPDLENSQGVSSCEYHTPEGCQLKSHKSPTCLSFLCKESIDFLRERCQVFGYDYLGIYYALEWILTGDMLGKALEEFKAGCLKMVEKVISSGNKKDFVMATITF